MGLKSSKVSLSLTTRLEKQQGMKFSAWEGWDQAQICQLDDEQPKPSILNPNLLGLKSDSVSLSPTTLLETKTSNEI